MKVVILISCCVLLASCELSVKTKLGIINGKTNKVSFREQHLFVNEFLGVPYAKPPISELRFQRPQPYGEFQQPIDGTKYGSTCPQFEYKIVKFGTRSTNEDCLFLNVFVPTSKADKEAGFAVMIWIHGGGYAFGDGKMTPGTVLAGYGNVIVVTINYRLGMFGFLNVGDERAKGNMGLWDQRLAIQWVNENVGAFGGDPSRITIFGESAGSMSVHLQSLYPENRGLFQNVISESGTATLPYVLASDNIRAARILAEQLECSTETNDDIFLCLKTVDTMRFVAVAEAIADNQTLAVIVQFTPSLDGEFIVRNPKETIKMPGSDEMKFMKELNYINGVNGDEGAAWVLMLAASQNVSVDDVKVSNADVSMIMPIMLMSMFPDQNIHEAVNDLINYEYTNWADPEDARAMFTKIGGDVFFNVPAMDLNLAHANDTNSNTWFYNFLIVPEQRPFAVPNWVTKANHAEEIPSVFGYHYDLGNIFNTTNYQPAEHQLDVSGRVMTYWTNFAKFGDPNGDGPVSWPKYTIEAMQHLIIDVEDSIGERLYTKEYQFWREIVPALLEAIEDGEHAGDSAFKSKIKDACDADGNCG
ncbi:EST2E-like protein [Mya arenaria]|uniref:Carboxylic ester hydrolase n=1 Tax=Mya arenaria TaxID=6604 RepID=A0ABY7DEY4_MYAAR|nr:pyrethroid hydrolase Ces2e-like [Mya arenaria]WAQ93590.1 EST2E-like protein [Mya arenaria]